MRDLWSTGVLSGQLLGPVWHAAWKARRVLLPALLAMAGAIETAHAATAGLPGAGQAGPPNEIYTVRFFLHLLHENNVLVTTDEFELGVRVECSNNVTGVMVTPPGGIPTALIPEGEGVWVEDDDFVFDDSPIGAYGLTFDFAGGATDSASVFFNPPVPGGFAVVTAPSPGSSCGSLDPTFTWEPTAGLGIGLFVDLSFEDEVFGVQLPASDTSWDPGVSLPPCTFSEFSIAVLQAVGSYFTTASGDQVFFGQNMLFDNTIHFTTCSSLTELTVPILATVGSPPVKSIGAIDVQLPGGAGIKATFAFAQGMEQLDLDYDFRWVNIVKGYAAFPPDCLSDKDPPCGEHEVVPILGYLPAIDPAPGLDPSDWDPPFNDPEPYYFTTEQQSICSIPGFGQICQPFASTTFVDARDCCSTHSVIYFRTLLVASSTIDPSFQPKQFCVLGGVDWMKANGPNQAFICGEVAASEALANEALAAASYPWFDGWQAVVGCSLMDQFSAFTSLGYGLAGSSAPTLAGAGSLQAGSPVSFSLTNALALAPAYFLIGVFPLAAPFKGGVMVPDPDLILGLTTNGSGAITLNGMWPSGIPAGTTTYYQWWIADAAGPAGFAASNAVKGTSP